jgi:hypothetical protein
MTIYKPLPPLREIKQHLRYEPANGDLLWLADRPGRVVTPAGSIAGSINRNGYRVIVYGGRWLKAHRLAWLMFYGHDPGGRDIDHINQGKADNRIGNLRLATRSQNAANNKKWKGGAFQLPSGRWQASCRTPQGSRYLGSYDTREEAVVVASAFRQQTYGDFAS